MRILIIAFILFALLCYCATNKQKSGEKLILLGNSNIEVGIVPDLGGRIVMLRKPGMNNIFESDTVFWNDPAARPEISVNGKFIAFNGHIVWLGPQSEWWSKQDVNPERKERKAIWPPDPWLTYGLYEVIDQTESGIIMSGPESPVSGVKLTKKLSFDEAGVVTFEVFAENIRTEPVSWGLWMNTRLDGHARCYVPADQAGLLRLAESEEGRNRPVPYDFYDGYFTFQSVTLSDSMEKWVQKAFINPTDNFIAGFSDKQMLMISFNPFERDQIHPDQAPVEIYNMVSAKSSLLELEVHGPYKKLQPGETMHLTETWKLFEYHEEDCSESHINFINGRLRGRN